MSAPTVSAAQAAEATAASQGAGADATAADGTCAPPGGQNARTAHTYRPPLHRGPLAASSASVEPLELLAPRALHVLSRLHAVGRFSALSLPQQRLRAVGCDAALPAADLAALVTAVVLARVAGWPGVLYGAGVLAALAVAGLHRLRICLRVSDQVGRIVAAASLPLLVVLAWIPYGAAVRLVLLAAALVTASRSVASAGLRAAHRRGRLLEPTLVVGTGSVGGQVTRLLLDHPELGLRPRGFLAAAASGVARPEDGLPLLGAPGQLAEVVARHGIRRVIICPGDSVRGDSGRDNDLVRALRSCRPLPADVCVVPRLHQLGMAAPAACLDEIWGIPLVPLRRFRFWRAGQLLKRAFDVLAAAVLAVAMAPLLLAIAAAVRLRSGAPVLFRQVRVVSAGRLAAIVKLRTLREHGDPDIVWKVPLAECGAFERWLRRAHLDELPQLVNVLRGEMSLVGPRPERPYFTQRFGRQIHGYDDRHRMRTGLTGWAQVHGLYGDTSIADRARFDNHYIEYWSPWLDLVILIRTLAGGAAGASAKRATPAAFTAEEQNPAPAGSLGETPSGGSR